MNESYYININDYHAIRNGLLDKNNNVVKTSIQSLITQLEENKVLNSNCSRDLCAILYKIVQAPDYKIRKWSYHLIAYKNTPDLISRCIKNLIDGFENDSENITWIMAIASIMLNKEELYDLYKKYAEGKIKRLQYYLSTTIFESRGIGITQRDIRKIIESEDFLAKIWLTKIYACVYKETKKKQYVKVVNYKVMNELLQEEQLNRYALWAFSTFEKVNLKKIGIKPHDANTLQVKSQAWYYNCLFKDEKYVYRNRDHISVILDDFFSMPAVVQGGILRGLERVEYKLGYMESKLVRIYFELDEEKLDHISLIITMTQILLKHVNESEELKKVLIDVKSTTKIEAVKRILFFINNEREEKFMSRTINFYGQNQYNEKPEHVVQYGQVENVCDERIFGLISQIKEITEKLEDGQYSSILDNHTTELSNMITNLNYELAYGRGVEKAVENYQIKQRLDALEVSVEELKNVDISKRKIEFSNILTKFSEVCTVITATPQLIDMAQNIMIHIRNFLNI